MTWLASGTRLLPEVGTVGRSQMVDGKMKKTCTRLTVGDIVLGLSRQPRFGGQTRQTWSVAHHTLVCWKIAMEMVYLQFPPHRFDHALLMVLLHDAHEFMLGDMPTKWKTRSRRDQEEELDLIIRHSLSCDGVQVDGPSDEEVAFIKLVDRLALQAEAELVGPEAWEPQGESVPVAVKAVQHVLACANENSDMQSSEGIARWLKATLAHYLKPTEIGIVDDFPAHRYQNV